jgi:diaminopimelate epimerase
MKLHLASGSGNSFAYLWADEAPAAFDGAAAAQRICPRGSGLGLDGLFLLQRPSIGPWVMEHWDADGASTFCSNGTRAAMALEGAPQEVQLEVRSNGQSVLLRRDAAGIGIRMPEDAACGLRPVPRATAEPSGFGWIGNPQLVLRVAAVADVDLAALAPPLRFDPAFEGGTNVNVVEVVGPGEARIRSWERGVEGETLCCGTGCAVAAAWIARTEGCFRWKLQPAGEDPVVVTLDLYGDHWRNLWLSGRVRRLGTVEPDPSLH